MSWLYSSVTSGLRDLQIKFKIFAVLFYWSFLLGLSTPYYYQAHLEPRPYKKVYLTPPSKVYIGQRRGRTEGTEQTYCDISLKISPSLKEFVAVEVLSKKKLWFWKSESGIIWLLDKKKSGGKIKHSDLAHPVFQRSNCFVATNHNDYFCLLVLIRAK